MPKRDWTTAEIPSQHGRLAIVTGATSGIGYEAALALAGAGARVVLAARDRGKAERAVCAIRRRHPDAAVEIGLLDTASLSSVHAFAQRIREQGLPIDVLLLNAGIAWLPRRHESEDGFELQLATNYLGHFALAALLLPTMRPGPASRIVPVASIAHQRGALHFDDLQLRAYQPRMAYRQSKLAMLMFGLELDRRLRASGSEIRAVAAHPGITRTAITRFGGVAGPMQRLTGQLVMILFGQSAARGALPLLYAATAPEALGGNYYGPDGRGEMRGAPTPSVIAPHARDEADARRLWNVSEEMTKVRWPFPPLPAQRSNPEPTR
ncbi:oxidoreductase [Methylobacterium brachythecii]|uniref:Dehydrogenase n=1 Tax=Methylobacterium brachythecii TaxID=1176177 RepID=A0A7W6F630_9HYPH|nr:oxidoreductase [Methylobacterium brachythecii]MBB3901923.1 NAD(P)-dependent dehydrogenase (short-subunit alcohol dehydrogenase family) [Methylobacterium brachythecii]GLS43303.1 dehydrogenase [Methylobacterium brachythecii]